MRNNIFLKKCIVFLGVFLIYLKPVYAYLDPGSGSMMLQILLGGIVAAGFIIKARWYKLKSRLFNKNKE
ncbi:hypothetical protein HOA91_03375 [Candidatus Woesearchaeota archaeon]|jgi:hypothetical protein|nr:hypothetical protein [Candidatus Woesearchaeota archaeon]